MSSAEPAPSRDQSRYIPTLDGWRAVAILLVVGAHSTVMLANGETRAGAVLARLLNHNGYGVDVFFALSGFLICTLLLRERARHGVISLRSFFIRRAFRILPPIVVYLIALLVLRTSGALTIVSWDELLAVLLFVRNYADGSWYTAHFWSLAVEEHFYLVIPWLLLIRSRRRLACVFAGLILACVAIRAFEFSHADLFGSGELRYRTENRFDALSWGGLLALALHSDRIRAWAGAHLKGWLVAATFVVVLLLLLQVDSASWRRSLVSAMLPLLIGYVVLNPGGIIGRLLEWAPLRWLGRLSYSLYIWQMLFLVPAERPLGVFQTFPVAFVASVACAIASFYLVERPCIAMGHRIAAVSAGPRVALAT